MASTSSSMIVQGPPSTPVWVIDPSALDLIKQAQAALKSSRPEDAALLIKKLQTLDPKAAGRVFFYTWKAAGEPTPKTQPGIAHPQFGRVAFFGEEGRSVTATQRLEAIEAALKELEHPEKPSCVFCNPKIIQAQLVYSDGKLWDVLQSLTPASEGHLLIIPKRHAETFDALTPEEAAALQEVVKICSDVFKKVFQLSDYLIIQKNGYSAGMSIRHLHVHVVAMKPWSLNEVVPKVFGERDRLIPDQMAENVAKLRPFFPSNKTT